MKQTFKTIALIAVMSLAATGCQKENISDPAESVAPVTMRIVTYNVDGVTTQVTLLGDEAWQDFLNWMFALAEEGHRVSFFQGSHQERNAIKETVTFKTTSQQEAFLWSKTMSDQGYEVTIDYDDKTGIYTCIAEK
jgi:hypothetical protein